MSRNKPCQYPEATPRHVAQDKECCCSTYQHRNKGYCPHTPVCPCCAQPHHGFAPDLLHTYWQQEAAHHSDRERYCQNEGPRKYDVSPPAPWNRKIQKASSSLPPWCRYCRQLPYRPAPPTCEPRVVPHSGRQGVPGQATKLLPQNLSKTYSWIASFSMCRSLFSCKGSKKE